MHTLPTLQDEINSLVERKILNEKFFSELVLECKVLGVQNPEVILKGFEKYPDAVILNMLDLIAVPIKIQELRELKNLSLQSTKLEKLDKSVFHHMQNLRSLTISYSPLKYLNKEIFDNLRELESLHLKHTLLDYLEIGIFDSLLNLRTLNIQNNHITKLSPAHFSKLHKLERLDLQGIKLDVWPTNLFRDLHQLQTLSLDEEQFLEMDIEIFSKNIPQHILFWGVKYPQVEPYFVNIINWEDHTILKKETRKRLQHLALRLMKKESNIKNKRLRMQIYKIQPLNLDVQTCTSVVG